VTGGQDLLPAPTQTAPRHPKPSPSLPLTPASRNMLRRKNLYHYQEIQNERFEEENFAGTLLIKVVRIMNL